MDINKVVMSLIENVAINFGQVLENYIIDNLKVHGHEFETKEDFYDFAKRRVLRAEYDGSVEVHYFLDFGTDNEKLIGITFEKRIQIDGKRIIIG